MPYRPTTALAGVVCALLLAGCAAQTPRSTEATLYQRLGGQAAMAAVVDDTIAHISADPRINQRFLTTGTRIMIHERQMTASVELSGPLKMQVANLKAKLHEIEESVRIEEEGFRDIIAGSNVTFDEVQKRAPTNWYIEAEEARDLGLVLDLI